MSRLVRRNPFAREELHRETVSGADAVNAGGCKFCGRAPVHKNGWHYLYRYILETDGGSRYPQAGLFCSVGCYDAYHG